MADAVLTMKPQPVAATGRPTGYPDGVYVVRGGSIRPVSATMLAGALWSDGRVMSGDLHWASEILANLSRRRPTT